MPPFVLDNRATIRKPLPGAVVSLGASKTAVVTIPCGPSYRGLELQATIAGVAPTRAEFEAMWTQLRLLLSGTELFTLTSLQLIAIVEFYITGCIGDTGCMYIPFDRNWQREIAGVQGPGIGTLGETSFSLEITQAAGNTIDAVTAIAFIDPVPATLGKHIVYKRLSPPLAGAGISDWTQSYKNPADVLYALHVQVSTAADLLTLTYAGDTTRIFDTISQVQLASFYRQQSYPARTLQTAKKVISYDFCADGYDTPVPLTMLDQLIQWNFANAPTVLNVIAEIGTEEKTQAGLQYAAAQLARAG